MVAANTVWFDDVGEVRDPQHAAAAVRGAERLLQRGHLADARLRFAEALEHVRTLDDDLFAQAALGLGGVWVHEHRSTVDRAHVVAFQREARDRMTPGSALWARLHARVAAEESYVTGEPSAILDAVERARATGDAVALAEALSLAHHCLLGPHYARSRLSIARELIEVSATTGRTLDASMGLLWETIDFFLLGDTRADRSLEQLRHRPAEDCVQYIVLALGVMQAIRRGELDRAEDLARECYEFGDDVGDADAMGFYAAHLVLLRWLQGREEELLAYVDHVRESPTLVEHNDAFTAALAAFAARAGRHDDARAALQRLRNRGFALTRNSSVWLVEMQGVVEAAYALGDAGVAREVYNLLAPYGSLPAMASLAIGCFGSTHRPLGLAALTFGDVDLAVAHLELAVDADLALGNLPCHALSTAALADALERRGGENERAVALRARAIEIARRCGMTARADGWASTAPRAEPADDVELHRDGRVWRVKAADRAVAVPHSIGMTYLARLVAAPGVEISAVQLAGDPEQATPARHAVLDDTAITAYRRRAAELQTEIDEAEANHDLERVARERAEYDALVDEVRRATGLLGRSRPFVDDVERARTSVQKAIKRAIARISDVDAPLGELLARRVVTGSRCVYLRNDD